MTYELNLDGLVGPTHHYAGLAAGNIASINNAHSSSNPQAAALQGLAKMRLLHQMGLKQGVLPPHQRPNLTLLSQLGFEGTPHQQLKKAYQTAPSLLSACFSASSMWTANAATVTPSIDALDKKVHFTAANLVSNLHRHQEADFSKKLLETIFSNSHYFQHHPIVPRSSMTGDEGAANHNRFCHNYGSAGVHLFVYGKKALQKDSVAPHKYPARQTFEASQAIARQHQIPSEQLIFACQNPQAIDLGVFHNDVISVANESVFLVHEKAFYQQEKVLQELQEKTTFPLQILEVKEKDIGIEDAVSTYLFNSQLLSLEQGMVLIAPKECELNSRVFSYIKTLIADSQNPLKEVHYLDLKQSMRNGGGPACLRLRVPLNASELNAMHQGVLINDQLLDTLEQWVLKHYRNELNVEDLIDPNFIEECFFALDELSSLLKLGAIYPFQQ